MGGRIRWEIFWVSRDGRKESAGGEGDRAGEAPGEWSYHDWLGSARGQESANPFVVQDNGYEFFHCAVAGVEPFPTGVLSAEFERLATAGINGEDESAAERPTACGGGKCGFGDGDLKRFRAGGIEALFLEGAGERLNGLFRPVVQVAVNGIAGAGLADFNFCGVGLRVGDGKGGRAGV